MALCGQHEKGLSPSNVPTCSRLRQGAFSGVNMAYSLWYGKTQLLILHMHIHAHSWEGGTNFFPSLPVSPMAWLGFVSRFENQQKKKNARKEGLCCNAVVKVTWKYPTNRRKRIPDIVVILNKGSRKQSARTM